MCICDSNPQLVCDSLFVAHYTKAGAVGKMSKNTLTWSLIFLRSEEMKAWWEGKERSGAAIRLQIRLQLFCVDTCLSKNPSSLISINRIYTYLLYITERCVEKQLKCHDNKAPFGQRDHDVSRYLEPNTYGIWRIWRVQKAAFLNK